MVDTIEHVSSMLEKLAAQSIIYIDLEAKALNRHGDIATLQIYDPTEGLTYIVDVFKLGKFAFDTAADNGTVTLRSILKDPDVVKGIFDCRQDSDALYGLYGIHLRSVHDIQLMALACDIDRPAREWLPGLGACIKKDLPLGGAAKSRMANAKDRCNVIFATKGYGVFRMRPLPAVLLDYAVGDVYALALLYNSYKAKLSDIWWQIVLTSSRERIDQSHAAKLSFWSIGKTRDKMQLMGPWSLEEVQEADHLSRKEAGSTRAQAMEGLNDEAVALTK